MSRGQPLATYDNMEAGELTVQLAGARAELERLRVQERNLGRQSERARALADIGAVPKKEFEQAIAEQQGAQQTTKSQESTIAGIVTRLQRFGISETEIGKTPITTITAPMTGVVTKQERRLARSSNRRLHCSRSPICPLSGVQAEVYEKDLGRVRVGQSAFVTVDTYADQPFTGKVTYISDFLDPRTRTARCGARFPMRTCGSSWTCSRR